MNNDKDRVDEMTDEAVTFDTSADGNAELFNDIKPKRKLNIIPKIVCLLFAVIIWYYVMQVDNPDYKQDFSDIKVNLVNTDELTNKGLSIFTGTSYSADITVSGKKSVINKYTSDDITIRADVLKNYTSPGTQIVDLDISLPSGLTLVSQDNTISVFVDEKTTVKIPVSVDQRVGATTLADYEAGTLTSEYAEVTVKGPKTIVDTIDKAIVKADFSEFGVLETTIKTSGNVYLYNKDGDEITSAYISLDYPVMDVTYPIYYTKDVALTVSYKYGFYNDENVSVEIVPATVSVTGDASYVKKLDSIEIAVIDEKQINKDMSLTYDLKSTNEYTFTDDSITSATVNITNVGTVTKIFRVTNLEVIGGDNKCEIADAYVDVTLRGTAARLSKLTSDDITLTCDISGYDDSISGEMNFDADVVIEGSPEGVWEIGSYEITVSVNE
ncbi:MAG: hypothetical protein IKN38_05080 [Clostridia bacterium]|nr:hypothetical protein [Clostridia bacterium]